MLLIVSFALVLLATALLVVGLLADEGITLIYISIGASALAAVVLTIAYRMAKPKPEQATAPAPLPVGEPLERTTVMPSAGAPRKPEEAPPASAPVAAAAADNWADEAPEWDEGEPVEFPIADYDDLRVSEIMPLLPQLYSDELDVVAEREAATKNRSTVLDRIEELRVGGTIDNPLPAAGAAAVSADDDVDIDLGEVVFPIADYDDLTVAQIKPLLSELEADELSDVRAREAAGAARRGLLAEIDRLLGGAARVAAGPAPAKKAAANKTTARKTVARKTAASKTGASTAPAKKAPAKKAATRFPIANYDSLSVAEIRPRLASLSPRQLEQVRARESAGAGRKMILGDIDKRLS